MIQNVQNHLKTDYVTDLSRNNRAGRPSSVVASGLKFAGVNAHKPALSLASLKANFMPVSKVSFGWAPSEHYSQGAQVVNAQTGEVKFKIWAPYAKEMKVQVIDQQSDKDILSNFRTTLDPEKVELFKNDPDQALQKNQVKEITLKPDGNGFFSTTARNIKPGDLYRYCLTDHKGETKQLKDLYSRSQPYDATGWSAVYDNNSYKWNDSKWMSGQDDRKVRRVSSIKDLKSMSDLKPPADMLIDEVHIKALTEEGNFDSARNQIKEIAQDGIYNTIKIMPVNEFPNDISWGYNGVDMYAAESSYGGPEKLKALIDYAHNQGLNVILDVVYNHWGCHECVSHEYGPYFHPYKDTGWGKPFNYHDAGEDSRQIRRFVVDNALYWLKEFHADGLRLDQTHQLFSQDTLKEIAREVRQHVPSSVLIAEDEGCLRKLTLPLQDKDVDLKNEDHISEIDGQSLDRLGFDSEWNFSFVHMIEQLLVQGFNDIDKLERIATRGNLGYKDAEVEGPKPFNFINYIMSHDEAGNHGGKRLIHKVLLTSVLRDFFRQEAKNAVASEASRMNIYLGDKFNGAVETRINEWTGGRNCDKALFALIKAYKETTGEDDWNKAVAQIVKDSSVKDNFHISRADFKAKLKEAVDLHRLALGILFITPGHKMLLMGDEAADMAPFEMDVRKNVIGRAGNQNPKVKQFTKDVSALWKKHPALKNGNEYNISTYKKDHAIAIHRFDATRQDNVLAIINLSENDSPNFSIPLPEGRWKLVANSNDKKYGGHCEASELTVQGQGMHYGKPEATLNLPKQSILFFEKVG